VPLPLMQRLRQGRGLGPLWHVAYAPECTITQPPPPSASQSVGQSVRRSVGRQSIGQSDSLSVNICQPVGQPASQRPPLPLRPPPLVERAQRWPGSEGSEVARFGGGKKLRGTRRFRSAPRSADPVPCTLYPDRVRGTGLFPIQKRPQKRGLRVSGAGGAYGSGVGG